MKGKENVFDSNTDFRSTDNGQQYRERSRRTELEALQELRAEVIDVFKPEVLRRFEAQFDTVLLGLMKGTLQPENAVRQVADQLVEEISQVAHGQPAADNFAKAIQRLSDFKQGTHLRRRRES